MYLPQNLRRNHARLAAASLRRYWARNLLCDVPVIGCSFNHGCSIILERRHQDRGRWSEAAAAMFDLEGTGQGVNFMRQALDGHSQTQDQGRDRANGGNGQRQHVYLMQRRIG
jgi:hypothetical protein